MPSPRRSAAALGPSLRPISRRASPSCTTSHPTATPRPPGSPPGSCGFRPSRRPTPSPFGGGPRVVRLLAPVFPFVGPEDGRQVELVHHLVNEVGQVVRGQPVPGGRRQQVGLVGWVRPKLPGRPPAQNAGEHPPRTHPGASITRRCGGPLRWMFASCRRRPTSPGTAPKRGGCTRPRSSMFSWHPAAGVGARENSGKRRCIRCGFACARPPLYRKLSWTRRWWLTVVSSDAMPRSCPRLCLMQATEPIESAYPRGRSRMDSRI